MMMIPLCDVPRRERRLLYCTDPEVLPLQRPIRNVNLLRAINRSLRAHEEAVDSVWLADSAEPQPAGLH